VCSSSPGVPVDGHASSAPVADDSLYSSLEDKVLDHLAGALWRGVYLRNEAIDEELVLQFARYLRREQLSLLDMSKEAIMEGRISWGAPPSWKRVASADGKEMDEKTKEKLLQIIRTHGIWKEAVAADGRKYYWNTKTRESQWEKPV
jgi:hypothetical protein